MKPNLSLTVDPKVAHTFEKYPPHILPKMLLLRALILETAADLPTVSSLEETLKWGEPSYITPKGSTLRMDWKEKAPEQYALYFKCTSKIVPTIKEVFGDTFEYEKDRALLFPTGKNIPKDAVKTCIGFALRYHEVKHLPLLGWEIGDAGLKMEDEG
ncbi:MAG: DUF1801 domain-containing protein [Saprospiraceae bacterium]|nr:DUF1801 domain-containing protein [Saprospiraceae bacterium]